MTTEKDRLDEMLQNNKITKSEYHLLLSALNKKNSFYVVFSFLVNPFQRIAGVYSLVIGLITLLAMSGLGLIAKVYFPGLITILNASAVKEPKVPLNFYLLLYQNAICWIVLTIIFIVIAKILQQKRIRIIDFIGTVALARFPFLILTGILCIIRLLYPSFLEIDLTKGVLVEPSVSLSAFFVVMITFVIWQITTYFNAFKESSGLIGKKLWIGFIIALILGEVTTNYLTMVVM